jgi:hypothetical protein
MGRRSLRPGLRGAHRRVSIARITRPDSCASSGDHGGEGRLTRLAQLRVPALVIGEADILVPVDNGATWRLRSRRSPAGDPGMGHDIPKRVWPQVVEAIAEIARHAAPAC